MKNSSTIDLEDQRLRVYTDSSLPFASTSLVFALPVGSRDEPNGRRGVLHFAEHLLPAVPTARFAVPLEQWLDDRGGVSSATTSAEEVYLTARVAAQHAPSTALRLLDAFRAPRLSKSAIAVEREVILQEIQSAAADPVDQASERLFRQLFQRNPIGKPVAGTLRNVRALTDVAIRDVWRSVTIGAQLNVAIVGSEDSIDSVLSALAGAPRITPTLNGLPKRVRPSEFRSELGSSTKPRRSRVHILLGGRSVAHGSPQWGAFEVLAELMGGSSQSILFRRLREDLGLTYDVSAWNQPYSDTGAWIVSIECAATSFSLVTNEVHRLLSAVADGSTEMRLLNRARRRIIQRDMTLFEDPLVRAEYLAIFQSSLPKSLLKYRQERLSETTELSVREAARYLAQTLVVSCS